MHIHAFFANNIWLLSITFMITAVAMVYSEYRAKKVSMLNGITLKSSLMMGVGQAVGVFPGISRSGATLTAGNIARVGREENANFCFLMSIPISLAAALMSTINVIEQGSIGDIKVMPLIVLIC